MVTFLIILYLILSCGATVLALWEDRHTYSLDIAHLAVMFFFWPVAIIIRALDTIEWHHIRNPFWKAGTP